MNEKTRALLTDILCESRLHINKVKNYLIKRNIDVPTQSNFQIGYLPDIKSIFDALEKNWTASEAIELALELKVIFKTDKYGSFLAGRLIFPIYDIYGRIIALAGRSLHEEKPKYYNTAFPKKKHLYGLNNAYPEILKSGFAIVVEGYMDVISSHRIGIKNTVAVMGTSFTRNHCIILSRYTQKSFLILDNDDAGQASTKRYMEQNKPNPLVMQVIPKNVETKDLDELINKNETAAKLFLTKQIIKV